MQYWSGFVKRHRIVLREEIVFSTELFLLSMLFLYFPAFIALKFAFMLMCLFFTVLISRHNISKDFENHSAANRCSYWQLFLVCFCAGSGINGVGSIYLILSLIKMCDCILWFLNYNYFILGSSSSQAIWLVHILFEQRDFFLNCVKGCWQPI